MELHDYKNHNIPVHAEYTGPLREGQPHRYGLLWLGCGDMYLGEFRNGDMDGAGTYHSVVLRNQLLLKGNSKR